MTRRTTTTRKAGFLRSDDGTAADPTWTTLSDPTTGTPGYGRWNFCQGQCSDHMVVSSPPGQARWAFLSGSMNYDESLSCSAGPAARTAGPIVRSADAGRRLHRHDRRRRRQRPAPRPPRAGLRAHVRTQETFFSGSDGGVVRQSGPYVDRSEDCTTDASRHLTTAADLADCQQYLSAVPTRNHERQHRAWRRCSSSRSASARTASSRAAPRTTAPGRATTGAASPRPSAATAGSPAFDPSTSSIRYHSYYAPQHDVSFDSGSPTSWDCISDPLLASGEAASFYTPFTADPVTAGTVFDGLQHVWRTTDNGGDRAFLDQYCNELTGDYGHRPKPCGDWVPLGGGGSAYLFREDPNTTSSPWSRRPATPGRCGLAPGGQPLVSTNADAANPSAVRFRDYDQDLGLPHRFPSGISIDPKNPLHCLRLLLRLLACAAGGHVYEVAVDPKTSRAPPTTRARRRPAVTTSSRPQHRSLFASTDFGVLTRTLGGGSWVATTGLPPVAVHRLTSTRRAGPSTPRPTAAASGSARQLGVPQSPGSSSQARCWAESQRRPGGARPAAPPGRSTPRSPPGRPQPGCGPADAPASRASTTARAR